MKEDEASLANRALKRPFRRIPRKALIVQFNQEGLSSDISSWITHANRGTDGKTSASISHPNHKLAPSALPLH